MEMARSRSTRSSSVRPSSRTPRKRRSQSLSSTARRSNARAERSSSFSSYSVRPRVLARTGDSSYSRFRNEAASAWNSLLGIHVPRERRRIGVGGTLRLDDRALDVLRELRADGVELLLGEALLAKVGGGLVDGVLREPRLQLF